jgi:hypothetical protein
MDIGYDCIYRDKAELMLALLYVEAYDGMKYDPIDVILIMI